MTGNSWAPAAEAKYEHGAGGGNDGTRRPPRPGPAAAEGARGAARAPAARAGTASRRRGGPGARCPSVEGVRRGKASRAASRLLTNNAPAAPREHGPGFPAREEAAPPPPGPTGVLWGGVSLAGAAAPRAAGRGRRAEAE